MRVALREAGVRVPRFWLFDLAPGPEPAGARVSYPCVLKPLLLSASRGVMRADDPASFAEAWRRIERILEAARAERRPGAARAARQVLVAAFVPGAEVALEIPGGTVGGYGQRVDAAPGAAPAEQGQP